MIGKLNIPGGWMWSAWQPDRGMCFNSYAFQTPGENGAAGAVAVDPLPVDEEALQWMASIGGIHTIVITNSDHQRASEALRERFGSKIIDRPQSGDQLFPGAYALPIAHGKGDEFAIHLPAAKAAVIGDALIGAPAGALSLLPDAKLADPDRFVPALRALWALRLDALLLCDGQPIFSGADAALAALLESRGGPNVNRINVEDLEFVKDANAGRYAAEDGEVGLFIGARKLGYRVAKVPPGKAFCPLHSHDAEEEFFYVLDGTPSVRTPRGMLECRQGDFIAFPTGERGTHQLLNDSAAPCTVLMVGINADQEVCFYPDSGKVLVDSPGRKSLMVRSSPNLDYFEGE